MKRLRGLMDHVKVRERQTQGYAHVSGLDDAVYCVLNAGRADQVDGSI